MGYPENKKPSVSILMPAYNVGEFIGEAIESVIGQTDRDWELIVVDDCSDDNTGDIVRSYSDKDSRIRYYRRNVNSGNALITRMDALDKAIGQWVCPVDADDVIEADYLSKMIGRMAQTGSEMVCPVMWRYYGGDKKERFVPCESFDLSMVGIGRGFVRFTLDDWKIGLNGCLYDAGLYRSVCRKFGRENTLAYADEVMSRYLLVAAGKVAFCDAEYLYRVNYGSITQSVTSRRFEIVLCNHIVERFVSDEFGKGSEEHILAVRQSFHWLISSLRMLRGVKLQKDDLERVRRMFDFSHGHLDRKMLKGHVNPLLRFIMSFKLPVAVRLLGIYDGIMRRK